MPSRVAKCMEDNIATSRYLNRQHLAIGAIMSSLEDAPDTPSLGDGSSLSSRQEVEGTSLPSKSHHALKSDVKTNTKERGLHKRFRLWKSRAEPRSAWMLLLFCTVPVNIIMDIEHLSLGFYYVAYVEYFQQPISVVAIIYTLRAVTNIVFGVVAGTLIQRYSIRRVCMSGGCLYFVAQLTGSFAPSIYVLYVTHGIMIGAANSMCIMCSGVIVQRCFSTNRALAGGINMLGLSIGLTVCPPLVTHLIHEYGWRGSTLIMSAISAHIILFASMFREPRTSNLSTREESIESDDDNDVDTGAQTTSNLQVDICGDISEWMRHVDVTQMDHDVDKRDTIIPKYINHQLCDGNGPTEPIIEISGANLLRNPIEEHTIHDHGVDQIEHEKNSKTSACRTYSGDRSSNASDCDGAIICFGSVNTHDAPDGDDNEIPISNTELNNGATNDDDYQMTEKGEFNRTQTFTNRNKCYLLEENNQKAISLSHPLSKKKALYLFFRDLFDFSLFRRTTFLIYCLCTLPSKYIQRSFIFHFPNKVVTLGNSKDQAAYLMSIFSIAGLLSRISISIIANIQGVSRITIIGVGIAIGALGSFLTVIHTVSGLVASSIANGVHVGLTSTINVVVLVDLLGVENLPKAMAMWNLIATTGGMLSGPLTGYIYEASQNYDVPFIVAGIMGFLAAGVLLLTVVKKSKRNSMFIYCMNE